MAEFDVIPRPKPSSAGGPRANTNLCQLALNCEFIWMESLACEGGSSAQMEHAVVEDVPQPS